MRLGTAIERLFDNYVYASDKEWINDKVAWALYQTWKEADIRKADTPQTEEPPCMGKPCGICNERNYCKFAERTDTPQTDCAVITDTSYQVLDGWQTREKPKTTDCSWK